MIIAMPKWTIDEGIKYIQELEPKIRIFGFFTALAGSVLYYGESTNDLDILIIPIAGHEYDVTDDRTKLIELINNLGAERILDSSYEGEDREVYKLELEDKRIIDFIVFY